MLNDSDRLVPGKAAGVQSMFSEIAPRYDFLNHALSLNIDRRWRRFVVARLKDKLGRPGSIALDLCCGTADMCIELGSHTQTIGLDFCHPMLKIGVEKVGKSAFPIHLIEADALRVPVADGRFDVVTIAFGLRNLDSVEDGLREMHRVLKSDGSAAVLEFSRPRLPVFREIFQLYFKRVLPVLGNWLSGSKYAYRYLPNSVQEFPDQEHLASLMSAVGFSEVKYYNLFGGAVALHMGRKIAP